MQSRKMGVALVLMTAVIVGICFLRFHWNTVGPDAGSKPQDKGSRFATTSPSQLQRTRTPWRSSGNHDAATAQPRPQSVTQGEGEPLKLTFQEIENFLQRNQRNAINLRTAFLASRDTNYLQEAAANFPDDPKVQLSILLQNAYPEERRQWLDAFKQSSPENSLANYLSAREYFNSGQPEEAVKELLEATPKPVFQDYTTDSIISLEVLMRDAGKSLLEARSAAMAGWAGEHMLELAQLKALTHDVVDLRKQFQGADDVSSVEQLSQMAMSLAGRLNSGGENTFMINQLVGISIEALALGQLPPDTPFDFLAGKTPKERTDELLQQGQALRSLAQDVQTLFASMTEAERSAYSDRVRLYGEVEAMRWLLGKRASPDAR